MRIPRGPGRDIGGAAEAEGRHIGDSLPRPSFRGRPWSWITGRPRLTDGLIVGFNLILAVVGTVASSDRLMVFAALPLMAIAALGLWWRRSYPLAVLVTTVLATAGMLILQPQHEPGGLTIAFAAYAVSVYGRDRARLWVAAIAMLVTAVAIVALLLGEMKLTRDVLPVSAISLIVWVIGDYARSRRRFFADMVARHRQEREQAAEEERLRIARELHDVVAHNVSAMAIQAGAARVAGASSREALASIEQGARDTLAELNKLVGVLRKTSDVPLSPQPTLAEAEALLKPARDAGLDATLKVTGEPRTLSAAVDLSAYRIVQEAITNVLKHANATRVEVTIDYRPNAVSLTITDNGDGPRATGSNGHGLVGMRERVVLFGGDLSTGSSSLGGFSVRATLPVKP